MAVALVVSGLPLGAFLTPVLVAVLLVAAHLVELVGTVPLAVWARLHDAAFLLPVLWSALRGAGAVPWEMLLWLVFVPGAVATLLLLAWVRWLAARAGVGGAVRRLGARRPRADDLAERRLENLAAEAAVACGVPAPRVRIVDTPAVNAAAIGRDPRDAVLVATRGFVDTLPRDEARAVVAHLVGSVANGDLRIATAVLAALQTWGLIGLLLEAPFGRHARAALRDFARVTRDARHGRLRRRDAARVLDLLLEGTRTENDDVARYTETGPVFENPVPLLLVELPLLVTFGLAAIAAKTLMFGATLLVAGPWVTRLWRARRRLADATAVQLVRDPDDLARALRRMSAADTVVPGAIAMNFLFPVWDPAADRDTTRTDAAAGLLGMHLEPTARLERLGALGAALQAGERAPRPPLAARLRAALPAWREVAEFVVALAAATLIVAAMIAATVAAASCVLMVLWWVLRQLFVAPPARLVGGGGH